MSERDEDEFREILRAFLEGRGDIDPSELARAAGLPDNPILLQQLLGQLQRAMDAGDGGVDWSTAAQRAEAIARQGTVPVLGEERHQVEEALGIAQLWLGEATEIAAGPVPPRLMARAEWAAATIDVWRQLAEPVAGSIADALTAALERAAPDALEGMLPGAERMMRGLGGALFAMQLGQVVGQLSGEVLSGGDIGIPLLDDGLAAVLPQNVVDFARQIEQPLDQVALWIAARELAHARLFRHARWLRLQLLTAISDYARGIAIDTTVITELADGVEPPTPDRLREALESGAFIPPKTPQQLAALGRLETTLALIEGWVDVVTAQATRRLPAADAIGEAIRRRRASGGPAEHALGALVGLELRPRRLREASAMWGAVTDAVGVSGRDALWSHPDLVPNAQDIDDASALVARLTAGRPEPDELDRAIEELLDGDAGDAGDARPPAV